MLTVCLTLINDDEDKKSFEQLVKKFEKKLEKIWRLKNKPYLCSRFQEGEPGGTIESGRR